MRILLILLPTVLALPAGASANDGEDRVHVLTKLVVEKGATAGDVVCLGCSVFVRGKVTGDVVTLGGDVEVEGSVAGDVATVGGRVRLHEGAKVEGDATALGGALVLAPKSEVGGSGDAYHWFYWPGQRRPTLRGILALLGFHGALLLMFYPLTRRTRALRMAQTLELRPWWTLLGGVLTFLITSALYWVAADATLSSPVWMKYISALIWGVVALQILALGFGLVGLSYRLGRTMRLRSGALAGVIGDAPLGLILAGTTLIVVVELLPIVGTIAFFVFLLIGMGATAVSLFGTYPRAAQAVTALTEHASSD